ncbi:allophanate hydrolase subunit 1 [Aeromicrobium sp. CTD01-1L150]|uniref:5-oxoprolinase subunit B family protein n=1 Tax=Aeromicrobium sp. CTD01-1L150 TaxID=3341830 RepID=UPI0035C1E4F9
MRWLPCGDAAAIIELDDLTEVLRLSAAIDVERTAGRLDGVVDVVPAARTVLVRCRSDGTLTRVAHHIATLEPATQPPVTGTQVRIPVRYGGADLHRVAALLDVDEPEVVRRHVDTLWQVAFTGFAPGFGYLVAADGSRPLEVPRHAEARTSVPVGAVGLAGEFSGVYPRSSPGGWQLIGSTDVVLWDVERDPPALLTPGTLVRFEEVR